MPDYITTQLKPLKFWVKALPIAHKVLLLYHYCPIDDSVGLYLMEELLLYSIIAEETFGWRTVGPSRWRQCPESDHHVKLVIKKHFSQRQNNALKRASGGQWSFHHLNLSFSSRDIAPLHPSRSRGAEKNGETCCQHKNSSQRLFVTTSSLIPSFLLPSVLEEETLCLQMPRSLQGRSNNKLIPSCRQPLDATRVPWQGRAGRWANISALQHAELGGVWLPVRRRGFPALPAHTYPAQGVLPGLTALPQPWRR